MEEVFYFYRKFLIRINRKPKEMIDFKVEEDKCIECGLCVEDCPAGIINLTPKASITRRK